MKHASADRQHAAAPPAPLLARGKRPQPAANRKSLVTPAHALVTHRTLVPSSPSAASANPPVQRREAAPASHPGSHSKPHPPLSAIQTHADRGTSGSSHALPFQSRIQSSFGRHDLSSVKAHTDAAARSGARSMQADAFTRGSHIAFAASPTLHLAAHEAAHVVQQRAGLSLTPSAGQSSDPHERHAEQVAHLVTQGQSAESLLDTYARNPHASSANKQPVQRFESEEHQHLGDVATGGKKYDLADKSKYPGDTFELSHGDIVALTGDVFPPDELFKLAAIPGDHGKKVGTRDEVICGLLLPAIWEMRAGATGPGPYTGKKDPRQEKGGIWEGWKFSDAVEKSVLERYQKLAAKNANHFAAPLGRDAAGDPVPTSDSAGGNYRALHEAAIRAAYTSGGMNAGSDLAMAREAAAQHFLTDSFSAGHLRTPIALIRKYWGEKYPLFWYNLRHKIALDTAIELTSNTPIPTHTAYTEISATVEGLAPTLPAITLGDLLGKVFHDVDNEQGVNIEGGGKVFGDAHLDAGTENLAVAAIKAGNKDITEAYNLGVTMHQSVKDDDLFAQVRSLTGGTPGVGGSFAPERMMPKPAATEPPQNWKAGDINALWTQKLIGTSGASVGDAIEKTVKTGAIASTLTDLAQKFPTSSKGVLHPRKAYLKGFVEKIQHDPRAGVLDIVNWAPHDMWTGNAERDMASDLAAKGDSGDKKDNLANMTPEQRLKITRQLVKDGKAKDQELILKVFTTLDHAGRTSLYQQIEGHPWNGDFQRSFGSRDDLYKAMDGPNVDKLKNLING